VVPFEQEMPQSNFRSFSLCLCASVVNDFQGLELDGKIKEI
jgi:hypothetical protein